MSTSPTIRRKIRSLHHPGIKRAWYIIFLYLYINKNIDWSASWTFLSYKFLKNSAYKI